MLLNIPSKVVLKIVWLPVRMTYCCVQRRTYPRHERSASIVPR